MVGLVDGRHLLTYETVVYPPSGTAPPPSVNSAVNPPPPVPNTLTLLDGTNTPSYPRPPPLHSNSLK